MASWRAGALHAQGVVHRDVKPGNVLITPDGRPVLTDFGIATMAGDPALTSTGVVLGSPAYMSPERARGQRPGPAGDLWSLGATLYSAVDGRPPFDAPNALGTLTAVISDPVEPPGVEGPLRTRPVCCAKGPGRSPRDPPRCASCSQATADPRPGDGHRRRRRSCWTGRAARGVAGRRRVSRSGRSRRPRRRTPTRYDKRSARGAARGRPGLAAVPVRGGLASPTSEDPRRRGQRRLRPEQRFPARPAASSRERHIEQGPIRRRAERVGERPPAARVAASPAYDRPQRLLVVRPEGWAAIQRAPRSRISGRGALASCGRPDARAQEGCGQGWEQQEKSTQTDCPTTSGSASRRSSTAVGCRRLGVHLRKKHTRAEPGLRDMPPNYGYGRRTVEPRRPVGREPRGLPDGCRHLPARRRGKAGESRCP